MVENALREWTIADLPLTYEYAYQGKPYAITRQWTIWRILSHDMAHGGQLARMLGARGIAVPELGDLGGHLTEPPVVEPF